MRLISAVLIVFVSLTTFAKKSDHAKFEIPFWISHYKCEINYPSCDPNLFQPTKHLAFISIPAGYGPNSGTYTKNIKIDDSEFVVKVIVIDNNGAVKNYTLQVQVWDKDLIQYSGSSVMWVKDPRVTNRVSLQSFWQFKDIYKYRIDVTVGDK